MKFEVKQINFFNGCLQLPVPFAEIAKIGELQKACNGGKTLSVEVKVKRNMRSTNANAYMWELCHKIAEKVGTTKETVYRKNIREVGSFETVELISEGVARFMRSWQANGLGWIAEPLSERNGYTTVIAYYGSSSYDTAEMSRLIEAVVAEAKALGVETMTPAELAGLKAAWKGE